jgi:arabinose-5-phosphate isomerase
VKRASGVRRAREVLRIEAEAVGALTERLDEGFRKAVVLILECKGRVIVTGMGKPGIIGRKVAATLASTGTPATSLHPGEAVHGDMGLVTKDDVVIAISSSGKTEEVLRLVPIIEKIGAKLVAMTGDAASPLAQAAQAVLDVSVKEEACPLGLVPTASTTAALAMGDALAIALLELRGFGKEDYALYHPGGALGRKLVSVGELLVEGESTLVVDAGTPVKDVLVELAQRRAHAACVAGEAGKLRGVVTQAALCRTVAEDPAAVARAAGELAEREVPTVTRGERAQEAWKRLASGTGPVVAVVDDEGRPVGVLERDAVGRAAAGAGEAQG